MIFIKRIGFVRRSWSIISTMMMTLPIPFNDNSMIVTWSILFVGIFVDGNSFYIILMMMMKTWSIYTTFTWSWRVDKIPIILNNCCWTMTCRRCWGRRGWRRSRSWHRMLNPMMRRRVIMKGRRGRCSRNNMWVMMMHWRRRVGRCYWRWRVTWGSSWSSWSIRWRSIWVEFITDKPSC